MNFYSPNGSHECRSVGRLQFRSNTLSFHPALTDLLFYFSNGENQPEEESVKRAFPFSCFSSVATIISLWPFRPSWHVVASPQTALPCCLVNPCDRHYPCYNNNRGNNFRSGLKDREREREWASYEGIEI